MGIGPGDEVICPSFTFYATRGGDRPARRDARLRRHRSGDAQPRPGGRRRAGSRRGRRRSCPCTCSAGRRRSPSSPQLGLADHRGRRAGVRLARRSRSIGVASTFSFFPTKNLFGLGDGGLVAVDRRGARRARPPAPLPRLARQGRLRARRLQLAPRRDPGRGAADLPAAARRVERARREAAARYPSSVSASSSTCRPRTSRPRLPPVRRPLAGARPDRRGADRGRDRAARRTTCTPLHLQPALLYLGSRGRLCRRPSRPRARTSRCRCGPGSTPTCRSGSSSVVPRGVAARSAA